MILTGKAKEDFYKYLNIKDYKLFDYVRKKYANEIVSNALIIEWFDSVGIIITSDYFELNKGFYSEILDNNFAIVKPTRQEALIEAIKKANEIYNSKI